MHFKWVPTKQSKKNATRKSLSRVTLLLLLRRRSFNPFTPCQLRKPPRCQPRRGQITARGSADTTVPRLKCDYCDKGAHRKRSIKKFAIKTNQTGFIRKLSIRNVFVLGELFAHPTSLSPHSVQSIHYPFLSYRYHHATFIRLPRLFQIGTILRGELLILKEWLSFLD